MALSANDIGSHTGGVETREVHVPAWKNSAGDDVVIVRSLVVDEMYLLGRLSDKTGPAQLLAAVLVDESGGRLFGSDGPGRIGQLPMRQAQSLLEAALELSGVGATEAAQAEADAEIAGESVAQSSDPS